MRALLPCPSITCLCAARPSLNRFASPSAGLRRRPHTGRSEGCRSGAALTANVLCSRGEEASEGLRASCGLVPSTYPGKHPASIYKLEKLRSCHARFNGLCLRLYLNGIVLRSGLNLKGTHEGVNNGCVLTSMAQWWVSAARLCRIVRQSYSDTTCTMWDLHTYKIQN